MKKRCSGRSLCTGMDFSPSGVAAPPGALYCSHNKHWCAREKFVVKNEATGEVLKTCDDCRMKVAGFYTVGKPPKKKRCRCGTATQTEPPAVAPKVV